jgi:hypothetical protein
MLMEWVWNILDSATSPRLTEEWFANGMIGPMASIAVGITVAMMLISAIQAGFGGRPELIVDALKEGPKSIVATALTVVVIDVLLQGGDVLADVAWASGRADTMQVLDGLASTMGAAGGGFALTFLGPLALAWGMIGLLVTAVVLFMRTSMLYLVAAFAPIVWSTSVLPMLRGGGRRLVHLVVALVLAKPAIAITLAVGARLLANVGAAPGTQGASAGASAVGTLFAGFTCFMIAGFSPVVIFKLLPAVDGASSATGIAGGWARSAMTVAQAAMLAKSFGATAGVSAASRALPATSSFASTSASAAAGGGGGGGWSRNAPAGPANPSGSPVPARSPGSPGGGRAESSPGSNEQHRGSLAGAVPAGGGRDEDRGSL